MLKGDWGYPGWVMSDWGATPTWEFALAGQDQESGAQIDRMMWNAEPFTDALREAHASGALPPSGCRRWCVASCARSTRSAPTPGTDAAPVDLEEHNRIALETARQGIVLLANDGVLPLDAERIAVIGGHAQVGVPAGTGSSAVAPPGGYAERDQARRARRAWAPGATCTCCRRRR